MNQKAQGCGAYLDSFVVGEREISGVVMTAHRFLQVLSLYCLLESQHGRADLVHSWQI